MCAVVVLPIGMTYAQGSDRAKAHLAKVKKELGSAVENGRISEEDAKKRYQAAEKAIKARMAAARGERGAKGDRKPGEAREYLMKVRKELAAAVEADKISKEDAKKKYQAVEKAIKEKMAAARGGDRSKTITREEYAKAEAKLRKMVAEGTVSAKDTRTRLGEMRRMVGRPSGNTPKTDVDWDAIKARIEGAVKSGKMTPEQADAAYEGIKKRMSLAKESAAKKITREEYGRVEAKLKKMVDEGKISAEDARTRLAEMRKMVGRPSGDAPKKDIDWDAIKARIEGAVKSGKMTREQADAAYKGIKERMGQKREDDAKKITVEEYKLAAAKLKKMVAEGKISAEDARTRLGEMRKMVGRQSGDTPKTDIDWDGIKKRIEGAVQRGDITRKEADAKYKALKERMGK